MKGNPSIPFEPSKRTKTDSTEEETYDERMRRKHSDPRIPERVDDGERREARHR